ncbi:hypothetical protein DAPPUDRAFT_305322 [Daphnia pulex]|uniref:Uncharacterized protein n=1 Tax=Daphnia pulex TaxID=6669 RepID=E9GRP1_DAPPU|nr:hypothetical protein DAPPUDRAFT_305322 [Daphnia pulex]|eukprot:EFX77876.1 hypothetical protein DAPPUDRAFT_305322 [Daphnia pulex]
MIKEKVNQNVFYAFQNGWHLLPNAKPSLHLGAAVAEEQALQTLNSIQKDMVFKSTDTYQQLLPLKNDKTFSNL